MYDLYWFFLSALTSQLYRSSVLRFMLLVHPLCCLQLFCPLVNYLMVFNSPVVRSCWDTQKSQSICIGVRVFLVFFEGALR